MPGQLRGARGGRREGGEGEGGLNISGQHGPLNIEFKRRELLLLLMV